MNSLIQMQILDLIDSGYWKSMQWRKWADDVILKLDEPPYWALELGTAMTQGEALSILRESLSQVRYADNLNHKTIILGYIFLRYKEEEINLKEFLTIVWQETECEEDLGSPSNSEIFKMYKEYESLSTKGEDLTNLVHKITNFFSDSSNYALKVLLEVEAVSRPDVL